MNIIQKPNNKRHFIPKVILNCLYRKRKALNCLILRADNKVMPSHINSMEWVNTEEMSG